MFLATTAIEEFWDKTSKIMFLGPWCIPEKNFIESDDYVKNKLVPSPWYPLAKRDDAYNYCHSLYERTISKLSIRLNKLHGVSYPDKYWQIFIGPWLFNYIMTLFDRYKRLEIALDTFPSLYTYVMPRKKCSLVSYSIVDFMFGVGGKVRNDLYNYLLFSVIAHEICPENIIEKDCKYELKVNVVRRGWKKRLFNALKGPIDKGFRGNILLNEMYHISLKELLMLKVRIGFNRINFIEMADCSPPDNVLLKDKYSKDMRTTLKINYTGEGFESILLKTIPEAIPICYIEDYRYQKNKLKTMSNLKFIGSLVGWYYNDMFKLYSAESKLKGANLAEIQHGGGYGMQRFDSLNPHICEKDIFYSWGWTDKKMNNVNTLPSPYLSRLMNTYKGRLNKILFVGTRLPRYMYRTETTLYPEDIRVYYHNKRRFLTALKETLQSRVMYRPGRETGWKEVDYITAIHPTIEIVKKKKAIHWMQKAKVVVVDDPHTCYLESLTINVPSVFYWNHEVNQMNSGADPFFQVLRNAGILYKDPISAAEKVNEIFDDPMEWWHSNTVQSARKEFCDRFAYTRKDWLDVWVKELRKFT